MNARRPIRSILVTGDELMARVMAAMFSHALAHHGCKVLLGELDEPHPDSSKCFLGPGTSKSFADIGLPPEKLVEAGASIHYSRALRGKSIMSAPYGVAMGGVEFHQHLHRVEGSLSHDAMLEYNPGYVVERHWPKERIIRRPPLPYGMKITRAKLRQLLDARNAFSTGSQADFTFEVRGDGAAEWAGNTVTVPASASFPELGLYRCTRAVERFLGLLPGMDGDEGERQEYNRIAIAEDDRITDFAGLLVGRTERPALARKIAVFSACGRIPVEDYELFPAHQWIGAFMQSGIVPRDYDRLADRIPIAETRRWLDGLRAQMDQLAKAGAA